MEVWYNKPVVANFQFTIFNFQSIFNHAIINENRKIRN